MVTALTIEDLQHKTCRPSLDLLHYPRRPHHSMQMRQCLALGLEGMHRVSLQQESPRKPVRYRLLMENFEAAVTTLRV